MGKRDPRIDAYIARSADFAKPILKYVRGVVHAACPAVEETMKWSLEWLLEARTEETRARRLKSAVEWISDGKTRNWKYQK